MKKSRFTDEQIVRALQEADRDPIAAVAKRHGVSEASIYVSRWLGMQKQNPKHLAPITWKND